MNTLGDARQDDNAPAAQASTYTFTNEDLAKAAAYSTAADGIYGPMSVRLNAVRFAVMHVCCMLHIRCMLHICRMLHTRCVAYISSESHISTQDTFASVLDMAQRLHLNCLTQKCEDMLAQEDFQLTTGRSTTDSHSVVKWAHISQKYHLLVNCSCFW
jgi:hypothetical protein